MDTADVRQYVFARERNLCRICCIRPATSMHELRFRSLGGKVSKKNSVAVCGDGTSGCHGFAQRNTIVYLAPADGRGAEGTLHFQPQDQHAADWMRVTVFHWLESPVMREIEEAS